MVITAEYKFPPRPRIDTGESPLKLEAISGLSPTLPLKYIEKRYQHGTGYNYIEEVEEALPEGAEKTLQALIFQANQNFLTHGVAIHLGLKKSQEGYELDIYDCTDGNICKLVKDDTVHIEDLALLVRNLQQEAGILLDTTA